MEVMIMAIALPQHATISDKLRSLPPSASPLLNTPYHFIFCF
ncbi:MAG: hypothetical protein V7K68_27395 [Nostoc sp.]